MAFRPWVDNDDILQRVKLGDYLSFVVSKPVLGVLASSFREHEVQLKNSHVNNVLDDGRVICVFVKAYRASSRRVFCIPFFKV